jgi:twitching motility protein PilT
MDIKQILSAMSQYQPSDLHLQSGCPPAVRVQGALTATKTPPLSEDQVAQMVREVAPDELWSRVESGESVQFLRVDPGQGRYRFNVFRHGGKLAAVARILPDEVPTLESLQLPKIYAQVAELKQGLVLVGGRAGSGRTSTVAALVSAINAQRTCKIVELAENAEYEHASQKAMVVQLRVGSDVPTLADAVATLGYHDPDVLVLGELNDWQSEAIALSACDNGLLVIATTVSVTAQRALEQLVGWIPADLKAVATESLAQNFQAICCQRLCRRKDGAGRVPATEVLRRAAAVESAIEEGDLSKLERVIGSGQEGMRSFDQDLDRLVREKIISDQEAMRQTLNPDSMQMLMRGFGARTK